MIGRATQEVEFAQRVAPVNEGRAAGNENSSELPKRLGAGRSVTSGGRGLTRANARSRTDQRPQTMAVLSNPSLLSMVVFGAVEARVFVPRRRGAGRA